MYVVQKNSFIITTLATFAILTTMTVMIQQQEIFGFGHESYVPDVPPVTEWKAPESLPPVPPVTEWKAPESLPPVPPVTEWKAPDPGQVARDTIGCDSIQGCKEEAQEKAGDYAEDKTGYRSTGDVKRDYEDDGKLQKLEKSEIGEKAGDVAEENTGYRSTADVTKFEESIPFMVPTTPPLPGTLLLEGDLRNIEDTNVEVTVAGFTPKSVKLGNDFSINTKFEATIEDLIRDLSGGKYKQIDEGKQMISDTFGIQIKDLAKLKMNLKTEIPIPKTISDITQIENLKYTNPSSWTSIESIEGCYNKISNNLPDVQEVNDLDTILEQGSDVQEVNDLDTILEQGSEVQDVINDPNNAINQEEVCTQLYPT